MLTCMLAVPCGFTQVRPWLYSIEAKRRRDHAHAWCRSYPRPSSTSVGKLDVGWRGHASLVLHVRSQHVWIRAAVQHRLLSTRWVLRALRGMRLPCTQCLPRASMVGRSSMGERVVKHETKAVCSPHVSACDPGERLRACFRGAASCHYMDMYM